MRRDAFGKEEIAEFTLGAFLMVSVDFSVIQQISGLITLQNAWLALFLSFALFGLLLYLEHMTSAPYRIITALAVGFTVTSIFYYLVNSVWPSTTPDALKFLLIGMSACLAGSFTVDVLEDDKAAGTQKRRKKKR